jgi:hypothetical protein
MKGNKIPFFQELKKVQIKKIMDMIQITQMGKVQVLILLRYKKKSSLKLKKLPFLTIKIT